MNRSRWISLPLSTLALAVVITACSDRPVVAPSAPEFAQVNVEVIDGIRWFKTDSLEGEFTIKPNDSFLLKIGDHSVYFPAYSVCAVSESYGPTEWDKPCKVSGKPIDVKAKVLVDATGRPRLEFQPKLRFAPGKDVILMIKDPVHALSGSEVWYCPDGTSLETDLLRKPRDRKCVNEGETDADVRTRHDAFDGFLIRKVKHFSGYEVAAT